MTRLTGWVGCVLVLVYGTLALAGEIPSSATKKREAPTTITADRLEVNRKEAHAIYTGNVVAKTTDFSVTADRMDFYFDEKTEAVERMVAVGNVEIFRNDGSKVAAERATYYALHEKVVLEGHPRAWQEGNMVSGARITLYIEEDRQVVEGDGVERVMAVIYPKRQP